MGRKAKKQLSPSHLFAAGVNQNVSTVQCTRCGKTVKIIPFGFGFIAACCNHVIYSDRKLPPETSPSKAPGKNK